MRKISIAAALVLSCTSFGQIEEVRRITQTLCSPEFHGRGYVERGDSIAAAFLAEELEKIDVGTYPKQNYLQHYTIEGVNRFPGDMEILHNGESLIPGVHFMVDPESGGGHTKLSPVVLEGHKLIDSESEHNINNEYIRLQLNETQSSAKNAVLIDMRGLSPDSANLIVGLSQALAEILPVIEVMDRKFMWAVGRKQLPNPMIFIQDSAYVDGMDFAINIDAEFVEKYPSQNVIGYIPAKKKCTETIVFTAHYDHLGRMGRDTYFPGANDNASGTAMLISMAKYFKEHPSKYNIAFIAFSGEEAGLLGSKYFVENTFIKLKKIKFLLNLDIMGSGEEGITTVNATLFEEQYGLMNSINEEKNLLAKVKRRGPTSNSDHYWFTQQGVPSFFIYTMGSNKNYHDVFDTYEELSFVEYEDITTLLVTFVERLEK